MKKSANMERRENFILLHEYKIELLSQINSCNVYKINSTIRPRRTDTNYRPWKVLLFTFWQKIRKLKVEFQMYSSTHSKLVVMLSFWNLLKTKACSFSQFGWMNDLQERMNFRQRWCSSQEKYQLPPLNRVLQCTIHLSIFQIHKLHHPRPAQAHHHAEKLY